MPDLRTTTNDQPAPAKPARLIVSNCKTGAWLRCSTIGQARGIARSKGWVDYTIEPDGGRHV